MSASTLAHCASLLARLQQRPLLRLLIAAFIIGLPFALVAKALALWMPEPGLRGLGNLVRGGLMVALYAAYVRWVEQRPLSELARAGALGELALGVALSVGLIGLQVGLLAATGHYRATGWADWPTALGTVLPAMAVVAVCEELLLRGLLFRLLEQAWGSVAALAVSSLLFGLMHFFNPNATLATSVALALGVGLMFAAAYVLTRRLWLPIGLHFGWNYAQAGLFDVPMSGFDAKALVHAQISGPDWLSGGSFGAEAALPSLLLCLATSAWMLHRARRQNRFCR